MLQKEDIEDSQSQQTRVPVRTDFAGSKPEGLSLKTEIFPDVHILNSNQFKVSHNSVMHVGNMKRHVDVIHIGLKSYQCQLCDYSATESGNLKRHVDTFHKGLRPYQCKQCNYAATLSSDLKNHVDAIHKGLELYR